MSNTNRREKNQSLALQNNQKVMNYRVQKGHSINLALISSQSAEVGKVDMRFEENMHKKHGIKLTESKMESQSYLYKLGSQEGWGRVKTRTRVWEEQMWTHGRENAN